MANQINTRIQLKYDSYAAFDAVKDTFKPLKGELCIVNPGTNLSDASTVPCLMKVGDGSTVFANLPWVSATAADVYAWAKKSEEEFKTWVKNLVPIEVIDDGTGKFVTDITVTNDTNGHHITITRADAVNSIKATDDDIVVLTPTTATTGAVTINGSHAKKGPTNGYTGTQTTATVDAFGESMTIKVPKLTVDAYGHTNAAAEVEYKITLPTPEAATNTVTEVEGKDAIKVEDKATDGNHDYEVSLALDTSGNVVLSQSATGLKAAIDLSAYRLIADDENTTYGLAYDSKNKVIKLVEGGTDLEIPASDFVADGMLESVNVDAAANTLTFKWNTTAGIDETTVKLTDIADIYTAAPNAKEVQVAISNTNVISASLVDKGVTEAKLDDAIIDKLNKQWQPSNYKGATTKTVTNVTQDEEGYVTVTYGDIAFPAAPKGAGSVTIATEVDGVVTLNGGVKLNDHNLEDDTSKADITLAKIATTGSIYDIAEGANVSAGEDKDTEYLIFNCGTATTVI